MEYPVKNICRMRSCYLFSVLEISVNSPETDEYQKLYCLTRLTYLWLIIIWIFFTYSLTCLFTSCSWRSAIKKAQPVPAADEDPLPKQDNSLWVGSLSFASTSHRVNRLRPHSLDDSSRHSSSLVDTTFTHSLVSSLLFCTYLTFFALSYLVHPFDFGFQPASETAIAYIPSILHPEIHPHSCFGATETNKKVRAFHSILVMSTN